MTYIVTVLEARVGKVRTEDLRDAYREAQKFEAAGASPSLGVFDVVATLAPPEGT